jgi:hypothetical protein
MKGFCMKIYKMFAVLAVTIMAFSVYSLKADETNSVTPPANQTPNYNFNFSKVDQSQVLGIYAKLVGVELKRNQPIPYATINFQPQKPLTRSEAIQAIEKVLREQAGIVLKPLDAKHFEVTYDESVKVKN